MPKWESNLNRVTCTIGPGLNFGTNSYKAMIPSWLLAEVPKLPEGWDTPECWVELDSGMLLPCFVPANVLLKFIEGLGDPRRNTFGG